MTLHRVTVRNRGDLVVEVDSDRFLLEGLEAAGLKVPFGCRFGACLTCTASMIDGEVDHSHGRSFALRPHQENDGFILPCVAQPRSDCVVDVGVRRALYVNQFRSRPDRHEANRTARKPA